MIARWRDIDSVLARDLSRLRNFPIMPEIDWKRNGLSINYHCKPDITCQGNGERSRDYVSITYPRNFIFGTLRVYVWCEFRDVHVFPTCCQRLESTFDVTSLHINDRAPRVRICCVALIWSIARASYPWNDAFSRFKHSYRSASSDAHSTCDARTRVNVPEIAQHLARISREHATALTRLRETFATGEATRFLIRGRGGDVSPRPPSRSGCNPVLSRSLGRSPFHRDSTRPSTPPSSSSHPRHIVRPSVRPSVRPFFRSSGVSLGTLHAPRCGGGCYRSPSDFGRRESRDTCVKINRSRSRSRFRPMYATNRTIPSRPTSRSRRTRRRSDGEDRRRPCASYAAAVVAVTPDRVLYIWWFVIGGDFIVTERRCVDVAEPAGLSLQERLEDWCALGMIDSPLRKGIRKSRSRSRSSIHSKHLRFLLSDTRLSSISKRFSNASNASRSLTRSQVRRGAISDRDTNRIEYARVLLRESVCFRLCRRLISLRLSFLGLFVVVVVVVVISAPMRALFALVPLRCFVFSSFRIR